MLHNLMWEWVSISICKWLALIQVENLHRQQFQCQVTASSSKVEDTRDSMLHNLCGSELLYPFKELYASWHFTDMITVTASIFNQTYHCSNQIYHFSFAAWEEWWWCILIVRSMECMTTLRDRSISPSLGNMDNQANICIHYVFLSQEKCLGEDKTVECI